MTNNNSVFSGREGFSKTINATLNHEGTIFARTPRKREWRDTMKHQRELKQNKTKK